MRTPTNRKGCAGNTLLGSRSRRTFVGSHYCILCADGDANTSPAVALDFPHTGNTMSSPLMAIPYCLINSS